MPPNGGVIANAVIEVTVDPSRLRPQLDEVRTEVTKTSASIANGSEQVGKSLKKQLGDFTGSVARAGAVLGTFVTFLRLGQQIREVFKSGTDQAKDFLSNIDTRNATEALAKVNAEIATVEDRLNSAQSEWAYFFTNLAFGDTPNSMKKQLEELRKTSSVLQAADNAKVRKANDALAEAKAAAEKKALEDVRAQVARDADSAYLRNLEGVDKINEEELQAAEEVARKRKASTDAEYQRMLDIVEFENKRYFTAQRLTIEKEKQAKIDEDNARKTEESLRRQAAILEQNNSIKQGSIDYIQRLSVTAEGISQQLQRLDQGIRGLR